MQSVYHCGVQASLVFGGENEHLEVCIHTTDESFNCVRFRKGSRNCVFVTSVIE